MKELRSNCCNAPMSTNCAEEGTCCYVCTKCWHVCDPMTENQPKIDRWNQRIDGNQPETMQNTTKTMQPDENQPDQFVDANTMIEPSVHDNTDIKFCPVCNSMTHTKCAKCSNSGKGMYEMGKREAIIEMIGLSDVIELEGDTTLEEWKAFKAFRNAMRDRLGEKK